MKTNKEKEIFFNEISERLQFYIMDYFQIEELEDVDSYNDLHAMLLYENAFDIEIIYYYKAMKYLTENDPSLHESMEMAAEFGYSPENLNSELLATLLATRKAQEEFRNLEPIINEFFNN